jgi:hypothetical protein
VCGAQGGICRANTFFNPVACFLYRAKDLSAPFIHTLLLFDDTLSILKSSLSKHLHSGDYVGPEDAEQCGVKPDLPSQGYLYLTGSGDQYGASGVPTRDSTQLLGNGIPPCPGRPTLRGLLQLQDLNLHGGSEYRGVWHIYLPPCTCFAWLHMLSGFCRTARKLLEPFACRM